MTQSNGALDTRLQLPFWLWPLAVLCGWLIAAASLSYAPGGRLNVLWLWWLWAGLPLLGTLLAAGGALVGRDRPWLFRWRQRSVRWYPKRVQRWQMLLGLQGFWLLLGVGIFLGFWTLLLFTDLAFGWSSTLLDGDQQPLGIFQVISAPWGWIWPSAAPDATLLEATRYLRIDPQSSGTARAGDWWPFLMASLLFYNIVPRAVLALVGLIRIRQLQGAHHLPNVRGKSQGAEPAPLALAQSPLDEWRDALVINWERHQHGQPTLGDGLWSDDQLQLSSLLVNKPHDLLWQVSANRSPVGELADLVAEAKAAGVARQGIRAMTDDLTQPERHLVSWRQFASEHQLRWVTE